MENRVVITQAISTQQEYIDRTNGFIEQYKKLHDGQVPSPDCLLVFIADKRPTISKSTWKKYRASGVYYFQTNGLNALADKLASISNEGTLPATKTSANKKKLITQKEEETLRESLYAHRSQKQSWFRPLYAYFETILCTGMRPSEIPSAEFIEDGPLPPDIYLGDYPVLKVKNAKATNGRSFGVYRYVNISRLTKEQHLLIRIAIILGSKAIMPDGRASKSFNDYYNSLRKAFARLVGAQLTQKSKGLSLYSLRHQCIADLKHADYQLSDIAAIVGHGSDVTATEHYGRRRVGRSRKGLSQPNPVDAAKVKPLMAKKMASKAKPTKSISPG